MQGIVTHWFSNRGFGFLQDQTGGKIFVHVSDVPDRDRNALKVDQQVEFELIETAKGLRGKNVRVVN